MLTADFIFQDYKFDNCNLKLIIKNLKRLYIFVDMIKEEFKKFYETSILLQEFKIPVYKTNTAVVGSGAAGLNAADLLTDEKIPFVLITEGIDCGTSRNTGSDKQTYYKLCTTGKNPDSVYDMAQSLYSNGAMMGDLALCEAANSPRAFFRLCELGVPFPVNDYGEYVGYKTDHDVFANRATSCGPLTSFYMTEYLKRSLLSKDVLIFDGYKVIEITVKKGYVTGLIAFGDEKTKENPLGLAFFSVANVIWSCGGPSAIYSSSVYPESQKCSHGTAFRAGISGVNLTESQYGIASLKFKWNLSGTYQQVIPRYISTESDGVSDVREFLGESFDKIFLKGYQWPFDPKKIGGSSDIDLAIYNEKIANRRVFLDYTRNPSGFSPDKLGSEAFSYLKNCGSEDISTPAARLRKINEKAYQNYLSHGIDLEHDLLEIDICAQHSNGGLLCDIWYESNIKRFFSAGEAAGVFGIYRPGGSALNSTQVSSMRAVKKISLDYKNITPQIPENIDSYVLNFYNPSENKITKEEILKLRFQYGDLMSRAGAYIRNENDVKNALDVTYNRLINFNYQSSETDVFYEIVLNYDILVTQYMFLSSIYEYINDSGLSRGSYLINSNPAIDTEHKNIRFISTLGNNYNISSFWQPVTPIPESEQWFEKVYSKNL